MTISLNKQFEDFIAAEIEAGRFHSATEVVEEALREMMERADFERLRQRLAESERQSARGDVVVADDAFFDRLRDRIRDVASRSN